MSALSSTGGRRGSALAVEFLDNTVLPTIDEFCAEPGSPRRARLAAIVISHFADYIYISRSQIGREPISVVRLGPFLDEFAGECADFALVRDMCDATKTVPLAQRSVCFAGKVSSGYRREKSVSHRLSTATGRREPVEGAVEVVAVLPDGVERPIVDVIDNSLRYLLRRM